LARSPLLRIAARFPGRPFGVFADSIVKVRFRHNKRADVLDQKGYTTPTVSLSILPNISFETNIFQL
jgi:hypothetical protein